jgi:hypothetical protein
MLLAGSTLSISTFMGGTNINRDQLALHANSLVAVRTIFVGERTNHLTRYIADPMSCC